MFKNSEKKMEIDRGVQLIDQDKQKKLAADQLMFAKKQAQRRMIVEQNSMLIDAKLAGDSDAK